MSIYKGPNFYNFLTFLNSNRNNLLVFFPCTRPTGLYLLPGSRIGHVRFITRMSPKSDSCQSYYSCFPQGSVISNVHPPVTNVFTPVDSSQSICPTPTFSRVLRRRTAMSSHESIDCGFPFPGLPSRCPEPNLTIQDPVNFDFIALTPTLYPVRFLTVWRLLNKVSNEVVVNWLRDELYLTTIIIVIILILLRIVNEKYSVCGIVHNRVNKKECWDPPSW